MAEGYSEDTGLFSKRHGRSSRFQPRSTRNDTAGEEYSQEESIFSRRNGGSSSSQPRPARNNGSMEEENSQETSIFSRRNGGSSSFQPKPTRNNGSMEEDNSQETSIFRRRNGGSSSFQSRFSTNNGSMEEENSQEASIFRRRNGGSSNFRPRSERSNLGEPVDIGKFMKNGQRISEIRKTTSRKWRDQCPQFGWKDQFDGFDSSISTKHVFHRLFKYLSEDDILGGSFDHLNTKMVKLTEDGGVRKQLLVRGIGGLLPPGCHVCVHYVSFAEGNDDPIDSTKDNCFLTPYKMGSWGVIPGYEIALQSMESGEVAKFIFEPKYAYGEMGIPEFISGNTRVLMAIEIIQTVSVDEKVPVYRMSYDERLKLDFEEIYDSANELRLAGNVKFERQQYDDAIERYKTAERILDQAFLMKKEQVIPRDELRYKLFANMAQCYLNIDEPKKALTACKYALDKDMPKPKNGKVYYRFALAAFKIDKLEVAAKFIQKAIDIEKGTWDLRILQKQINNAIKEEALCRDEFYKKMVTPSS